MERLKLTSAIEMNSSLVSSLFTALFWDYSYHKVFLISDTIKMEQSEKKYDLICAYQDLLQISYSKNSESVSSRLNCILSNLHSYPTRKL